MNFQEVREEERKESTGIGQRRCGIPVLMGQENQMKGLVLSWPSSKDSRGDQWVRVGSQKSM